MASPIRNPYYNVAGIGDPLLFFDRSANIEILLNSLFSGPPQCLSIVGQRKVGKTSLVQHLSLPTTIRSFQFDSSGYLFLYFNCQNRPNGLKCVDSFYRELLVLLHSVIPDHIKYIVLSLESKAHNTGQEWERALKALADKGVYVVVIFDEFEKAIIQNELITQGLFGGLRGYAQENTNFAWVTCTSRFLHELFDEAFDEYNISKAQRKSESDFFNIAPPHVVGLFDESDTQDLIKSPAESRGISFSDEETQAIIRFGGNFPYFIQRACYHFFNAHSKRNRQHEIIFQQCVKESLPLWESYWEKLTAGQQATLFSIANQFEEADASVVERLKDAALVYQDRSGEMRSFSEAFCTFVQGKSGEIQMGRQTSPPLAEIDNCEGELFPMDILKGTRDYIERIGSQVNGCYKEGWYDACAVMIRRLIETLIIESFEHHKIAGRIIGSDGSYLYLRDLVSQFLSETSWNASRNSRASLPKLKDIGDLSAHSRRFVAKRGDIDRVMQEIRIIIQELIYIAGFDKH